MVSYRTPTAALLESLHCFNGHSYAFVARPWRAVQAMRVFPWQTRRFCGR